VTRRSHPPPRSNDSTETVAKDRSSDSSSCPEAGPIRCGTGRRGRRAIDQRMASDRLDEHLRPATVRGCPLASGGGGAAPGLGAWCPSSLMTDRERCQDFRTAWAATPGGRSVATAEAGRRQHSRRFGTAIRISRVAASWPGPIWTLSLLWAAASLRLKPVWRLSERVRVARRHPRPPGSASVRKDDPPASSAADRSPRWIAPGFRCLSRRAGAVPLRRGPCRRRRTRCRDGVDPRWRRFHPIEPPCPRRRGRGMLA
jgi:hypothetical protein